MKIIVAIVLISLTLEIQAQNPIYFQRKTLTPQQKADELYIYQQQQKQIQLEYQQQKMQDEIDRLNSDILSKSNALQKLLSPSENRYFLSASDRTNITERLKELSEQKRQLPNDPWRKINGKIIFVRGESGFAGYTGKILQTTSDGILMQSYASLDMANIFIKNFPYVYGDGAEISLIAMPCKPYSYSTIFGASETVNAADYGIPCSPPSNAESIEAAAFTITPAEENEIKKDADSALVEITKANSELEMARKNLKDFFQNLEDERQAALNAEKQKKKDMEDRVLKSNEDLAAQGDAYGLRRMGERYRDGDGVAKDFTKAKIYLQKASEAGSETASNELSTLSAN
jgi:hypothetical protein